MVYVMNIGNRDVKRKTKGDNMSKQYEQYEHHGNQVMVRCDLKGKHRDFCLCWKCNKFKVDDPDNKCKTADAVFQNCLKFKIVTPMWECPDFEEKD